MWDLVKYKIRQVSKKYRKGKARVRRENLEKVESDLKDCQAKCAADLSDSNIAELQAVQSKYDSLYDYIIRGNIMRSKSRWYEQGEKKI